MNFLEKIGTSVFLTLFLFISYSITAETKKLLILGDSISAGYGIGISENWVTILQNEFDKENLNITLINASVSGDTSIGGLSRIKTALKNFNPEFVLVELGGNDALRGYPPKIIGNNLSKIIKEVKENGSKPFLMQIRIPPNYGKKYTIAFESVFQEIAKKEGIPLIPFMLNEIALDKDLMQLDGIHPNTKAQSKIAGFLKKELILFLK
tara:strand:- start:5063 stop:5689 length:627 start_codon:yes stop_codon:yes gene_type:complete